MINDKLAVDDVVVIKLTSMESDECLWLMSSFRELREFVKMSPSAWLCDAHTGFVMKKFEFTLCESLCSYTVLLNSTLLPPYRLKCVHPGLCQWSN